MRDTIDLAIFIGGLFFWFMVICFLILIPIMLIATREKSTYGPEGIDEADGTYSPEEFARNIDRAWRDWNDNDGLSGVESFIQGGPQN